MNYSKKSRMGLAVGLFLVLSTIAFGTVFYVALSASNVEIVVSEDDARRSVNDQALRVNEDYLVSVYNRFRGGPFDILPYYDPRSGIPRDGFVILPELRPLSSIQRDPIVILPFSDL